MNTGRRIVVLVSLILMTAMAGIICQEAEPLQAASYTKVKYNGKTYKNKSKKMTVRYNGKTVSKSGYRAMVIKKSYMVPYYDVFKSGVKASARYSKKTKKIKIKKNGVTITMKVGSKTAYVNGKKKKLKTAPISLRYVSKKKTKIVVPVSFVAKNLHLSYKKVGSRIELKAPVKLSYDNATVYYSGVQGAVYYNHTKYNLKTMPVIKIRSNMYMPAKEVLSDVMKLTYKEDGTTGKIEITNEDTNMSLQCTVGSRDVVVNGTKVTMGQPVKKIKNLTKKTEAVCVPAAAILKYLGYTRSWNKTARYYAIQSKVFFDWQEELTAAMKGDTETNYIYGMKSSYSEQSGVGVISFVLTGSLSDAMKDAGIVRDNKDITITLDKAKYNLAKDQFSNFGEMIQKISVTEKDNKVVVTINCKEKADFSYIVQGNVLTLNIMSAYSSNTQLSGYSLTIKKPSGTTIADVSNEDIYMSKKFKIKIRGDHVAFYKSNPVILNNNGIRDVTVAKNGTNTEITVTTSSLQGYKIYEQGDNFVVKVGNPRSIYKNILVLDAGHGGHDPGAQNKGKNEKDITFKILYTYMKDYFSSNAPDIKVYWTRTNDSYITLSDRAKFAKTVGADAFISLHMNSASNSSANGTEVYYSVSNNSSSFSGITSKTMANLFRSQLLEDLGTKNRGTKTAGYYVIKNNSVPAILIELGFISGSSDFSRLTSENFQKKAAKSLYTGIVKMFSLYQTGR